MARKREGLQHIKEINGVKRFSYNPHVQSAESKEAKSRLSAHQARKTRDQHESGNGNQYQDNLGSSRASNMGSQQGRNSSRFQVQSPDSVEGQSYRDQSNSFLKTLNALNAQNQKVKKVVAPHGDPYKKSEGNVKSSYDQDPPKQNFVQASYSPIQKLQDKLREGEEDRFKFKKSVKPQVPESRDSKRLNQHYQNPRDSRIKVDFDRNSQVPPPRFDSKRHNTTRSTVPHEQRIPPQPPRHQYEKQSRKESGRQTFHYSNQKLSTPSGTIRPPQAKRMKSDSVRQKSQYQISKRQPTRHGQTTEGKRRASLNNHEQKDVDQDHNFGRQHSMRKSVVSGHRAAELPTSSDGKGQRSSLNVTGNAESKYRKIAKNDSSGHKSSCEREQKSKPRQQQYSRHQVMQQIREIEQINSDQESKLSSFRNDRQKGQEGRLSQGQIVEISEKAEQRFQQFLNGLNQIKVVPPKTSRRR